MATPDKNAWKRPAGAPAGPGKPASWKPTGPAPGPVGPSWLASRGLQIGLVVFGLLGVSGAMLVVLLWPRPDPAPALVILEAGYETNLGVPHNAPGRQATRALVKWAAAHGEQQTRGDIRRVDVKQATLETGGEAALKVIEGLRGGWNTKAARKVVVFVAAHGLALPDREDGGATPYLIPENHDPANPEKLFKLETLIEALGKLPASTHKLLLLDCGMPPSWSLGQYQPGFVAALESERFQDLVKQVPHLAIITDAGRGQPAWVAPELRMSAFAHFVVEGLSGAADKSRDDMVGGLELFEYVSESVAQWARNNRDRAQVPALYPMKEAGREIVQQMTLASHEGYKQAPLPPAGDGDEKEQDAMQKAWAQAEGLAKSSVWEHAPQWWRRYLDVLLRAEQLARAGDADTSRRLRGEADDLARKISRSCTMTAASSRLCIPQADALGFVPSVKEKEWSAKFTGMMTRGEVAACAKMASDLEKSDRERPAKQWLRLGAWREAIRHVASDPAARLASCKPLLTALEDASEPRRPAEGHWLAMLLDASAPPPGEQAGRWPLIGRALRLRLQSEEAAVGGGEDVLAWVRPLSEAGDRARRTGQDLLFATRTEQWTEASKLFDEADKKYVEAKEAASQARRAMQVCREALAWLPFASHWLAEQRTQDDARRAAALWGKVHELHKALLAHAAITSLTKLRGEVSEGLAWLRGEIGRERAALAELGDKQDDWHRAESALRLPGGDPAARRKLVRDVARVSRQLHEDSRKAGKAGGAEDTGEKVRGEAARHARLALAAVGDPELKADDPRLGPKLAARFAAFAVHAQERAATAATSPLKEAKAELIRSVADARRVAGWAVGMHLERDPAQALRQVCLHDLLCWQAERAFLDHWASPAGEGDRPYWRAVAAAFLADARLQAETGAEGDVAKNGKRLIAIKDIEKRMATATPLRLEWSASRKVGDFTAGDGAFHLTDEPLAERFYRLSGPAGIDGQSVRWVETGRGLEAAAPGVLPWELGKPLLVAIRPDADLYKRRDRKTTHAVNAYFRGQRAVSTMAITIHREPDHLAVQPPLPKTAHLAVLTDRKQFELHVASKSALCIILDCSNSMRSKAPDGKGTRMDAAKKALGEVMRQMPNGVKVSLIAMGAEGYEDKEKTPYNERTGGLRVVWKQHGWKEADFDSRMAAVYKLQPASFTPLMRSLKMAREQLPESCRKRRSIVAITDGGDFNFYRKNGPDADLKRRGTLRTIRAFLEDSFKAPFDDVTVNVIGFAIDTNDMQPWEKTAHQELKPALEVIKGEYFDAKDTRQLTALLMRSLLRLDYRVDAEVSAAGAEKAPPEGTISRVDRDEGGRDNLRWLPIPRDEHKLYVPLLPGVQQRIRARPGDALVLELLPRADSMAFRRWMYINSLARSGAYHRKSEPLEKWVLGAMENYQAGTGGLLRAMATLEENAGVADARSHLQMIRPTWTWFELVQTADSKLASALRVVALPNYPAPAWGLEAPNWRLEERASLKAWWLSGTPPRAGRLADLRERSLPDLREQKLDMENADDEAMLESVVYEKTCRVPYKQDGNEDVLVHDCMVVRLRYPPGKGPYFVQVGEGDWQGGQAHRFFRTAGKSTGVFWPVKPEEMAKFKQMRIYSVARLKAKSLGRRLDLGSPGAGNVRPQPVGE